MLEARHLVKRFFGTAVVSDVSFDVRAGEVVGYLGPNGSGKSTTAKMLAGLLEPSAGTVLFDGQDIAHDPVAFHRRLGYVPEEPNLYTFQSAIEYLELVEKACDRVVVIHRGNVVASDTVEALRRLMTLGSLEEVFSQLVLRVDPERTAADIADMVAGRA